jgi:hypothetical protein
MSPGETIVDAVIRGRRHRDGDPSRRRDHHRLGGQCPGAGRGSTGGSRVPGRKGRVGHAMYYTLSSTA